MKKQVNWPGNCLLTTPWACLAPTSNHGISYLRAMKNKQTEPPKLSGLMLLNNK